MSTEDFSLSPQACDNLNLLLDDALLGKTIREMLEGGAVQEIVSDAVSAAFRYGFEHQETLSYVDSRLRSALPLERTVHEHSSHDS